MPTVALTMIVKNEEALLPRCLGNCYKLFDEIVIVDTGSTDKTKEIAKSFGAKVIDFKWIDDFAAARNCAIENTNCDWIFTLDADEYITPDNAALLKDFLKTLNYDDIAYILPIHRHEFQEYFFGANIAIRMFQKKHQWTSPVHENVHASLKTHKTEIKSLPIYVDRNRHATVEELIEKESNYTRLILKELEHNTNDSHLWRNLGLSFHIQKMYKEAIEAWKHYFSLVDPFFSPMYQPSLYYYLLDILYSGQVIECKKELRNAKAQFPKNCLFLYLEANILQAEHNFSKAEECLKAILELASNYDEKETLVSRQGAIEMVNKRLVELSQQRNHS